MTATTRKSLFLVLLLLVLCFSTTLAQYNVDDDADLLAHDDEDAHLFTNEDYETLASDKPAKSDFSNWDLLQDLLQIKAAGGALFNPRKKEIMYISNEPGVFQIYTVQVNDKGQAISAPKRLVNTQNRCSAARYLSDGSIMYLHDRGGDENFQIRLITPQGKEILVTNDTKSKNTPNTFSSKYLYFTSNKRNKKIIDIYRRELPLTKENAKEELVYTPSKGIGRAILSLNKDKLLLLSQHYSNLDSELLFYNLETKKTTSVTKKLDNVEARWSFVKIFNGRHPRFLVKTDYNSQYERFAYLDFDSKDLENADVTFTTIPQFERKKFDITSHATNRKTKQVYVEFNEQGYSKLYRIKMGNHGFVGKLQPYRLPLRDAVVVHGGLRSFGQSMTISPCGTKMAVTLSSDTQPLSMWIVDLTRGDTDPTRAFTLLPTQLPASLKSMTFSRGALNKFKSFDGKSIPYFYYEPSARHVKPRNGWPTIVKIHGGPETQSRPQFDALTQIFTHAGFAVAIPNIRGSSGYGKNYLNADNQEKRMDAITDIKELAVHLPRAHAVDKSKLVVMGGSYGGYATLMAITQFPQYWKAAVDIVGMSNLITFFKHTAEWRRKLRAPEYGDYHTQKDLLRRISPINFVERITCPVFIIQGSNDERVPVSEATQIYDKLKQVGKEKGKSQVANSKLMVFKDEGHGLSKRKNRLVAYHELLTWLQRNVQNAK